ncbi:MAG: hypothetical protein MUC67_01575 [Acidobacteria bacterium]|jgi:hypothetical protein|nr:hypothetical protein [Acidobacteriota bacterium]
MLAAFSLVPPVIGASQVEIKSPPAPPPPSGTAATPPATPARPTEKIPAPAKTLIEGQAFDRSGNSLPGLAVRLTLRNESVSLPWKPVEVTERVVASAVTDAAGFYSLALAETDLEGTLWLRCGDPAKWDAVRFAPPAEYEVSSRIRRGRTAIFNCVPGDAPGWPELAREINQAGGLKSPRGKVLRARGLPPETVTLVDGTVEWRYPNAVYRFRGAELVEGPPAPGAKP